MKGEPACYNLYEIKLLTRYSGALPKYLLQSHLDFVCSSKPYNTNELVIKLKWGYTTKTSHYKQKTLVESGKEMPGSQI